MILCTVHMQVNSKVWCVAMWPSSVCLADPVLACSHMQGPKCLHACMFAHVPQAAAAEAAAVASDTQLAEVRGSGVKLFKQVCSACWTSCLPFVLCPLLRQLHHAVQHVACSTVCAEQGDSLFRPQVSAPNNLCLHRHDLGSCAAQWQESACGQPGSNRATHPACFPRFH